MSTKLSIFLISVLLLVSGCASNHTRLLYNKKPAFYSYIFGDVQSKHIDAEHEADVYVAPASCQKTLTALLAYKTLGVDYRYETKLYVTKKNHKVHDVVVSFAGDPTLTMEDLERLLKPINGVAVTGKIFLDASLFKTPPHSPNLMIDDMGTDYGQPVSSINVDKNLIIVTAQPNKIGKPAFLANDSGYLIDSDVVTTLERSSIKLSLCNNRIKASGNINFNEVFLELKISPIDFDRYVLYKIKRVMKSAGVKGRLVIVRDQSQLPAKLVLLNTIKSEALGSIIPPALKKSDNLVFDSLYLKIVNSQITGGVKNWNEGDEVFKRLIHEYFNIEMENAMFVDGSGLSRYNRVQPRKLFAVLRQGYYISEFVKALPGPGEPNSTLAKRADLLRSIKAKTGAMSGISCLCGYSINKRPKTFVIVANSFAPPAKEIFPVLDGFVNGCLDR
ncbi:MAG: D-alanyl-D-alanine carboxypeptidase [uncultured bacterium]|nr:MAG: D-alanyl-D-alanine carboxypeptidase [uncultured bacterium]